MPRKEEGSAALAAGSEAAACASGSPGWSTLSGACPLHYITSAGHMSMDMHGNAMTDCVVQMPPHQPTDRIMCDRTHGGTACWPPWNKSASQTPLLDVFHSRSTKPRRIWKRLGLIWNSSGQTRHRGCRDRHRWRHQTGWPAAR